MRIKTVSAITLGLTLVLAGCAGTSDGNTAAPVAKAETTTAAPTTPASVEPSPAMKTVNPTPAATKTAKAKVTPAKVKVPNGVGLDYQSAQDLWRAAGLHVAPAVDATGAHRLPVLDSNWVVLSQKPKAGTKVAADSFITATVKKYSDS